ncbi:Tubulin [Carpediemonas membranifera]|uniref:Tubulin gamma chain n=1 Tax=Carpediemonas membranifera TaxID=201153 RepID=A0A8J6E149_9EUKA|nr:Tubulin [Carpediemonas membranifera]|eukprot:KAG9390172.1 Tubulin [Carpediemonas membranifera]
MAGEVVSLHVGQAGVQIGWEYWRRLTMEHGIEPNGTVKPIPDDAFVAERKDTFFSEDDHGLFMPRALFIDLEPSTINQVDSAAPLLYNPDNLLRGIDGDMSGAGNNWAEGYYRGEKYEDLFLDMIRKEVSFADSVSTIQMTHSIAGGTGSGLGSFLLEKLRDEYRKVPVVSWSVFPHKSDVIVQPYNCVLALQHLIDYADATVVLGNEAISRMSSEAAAEGMPRTFNNGVIAEAMSLTTTPPRFPSWGPGGDMAQTFSLLTPEPMLHFLVPSITPLPTGYRAGTRITSMTNALSALMQPDSRLVDLQSAGRLISSVAHIQGNVKQTDVAPALAALKSDRHFPRPVDWCMSTVIPQHVATSPFVTPRARTVGCMLTNSTGVRHAFSGIVSGFDTMFDRKGFLHHFGGDEKKWSLEEAGEALSCAAMSVKDLCAEYEKAEGSDYLDIGY